MSTSSTRLIEAGVDVFRLNFSHGDRDRHAQTMESIRDAASQAGREVAVLGDLPGPKLRVGELRDDVAELETGSHVKLTPQRGRGRRGDDPGRLAGGQRTARERAGLPGRRRDPPAGARARRTEASTARSRWAARSPRTRA